MARPPRFHKRRSSGRSGFVDSVKGAMKEIQEELERVSEQNPELKKALRSLSEARPGEASPRDLRAGVSKLRQQAEAEDLKKRAQRELKKRLKQKQRERAAREDRAARPERRAQKRRPVEGTSLEGPAREARSIEGRGRPSEAIEGRGEDALSLEGATVEGDTLEGEAHTDDCAVEAQPQAVANAPTRAQELRRMLSDRPTLRRVYLLHEILGPPKSLR